MLTRLTFLQYAFVHICLDLHIVYKEAQMNLVYRSFLDVHVLNFINHIQEGFFPFQLKQFVRYQGRTIGHCQGGGGNISSCAKGCKKMFLPPPLYDFCPPLCRGKVITEGGNHLLSSFIIIWLSVLGNPFFRKQ